MNISAFRTKHEAFLCVEIASSILCVRVRYFSRGFKHNEWLQLHIMLPMLPSTHWMFNKVILTHTTYFGSSCPYTTYTNCSVPNNKLYFPSLQTFLH